MRAKATIATLLIAAATAWAQSPQIISSTKANLQSAQKTWNAQQGTVNASAAATSGKTEEAQKAKTNKTASAASGAKEASTAVAGTEAGEERLTEAARRDANKRDPFTSPVQAKLSGPGEGCTGGKKCLAVDQISLRGIVKSEAGMIAVVTNSANKAYFLRENDPVFNGFVTKITGDSVVFHETVQDALGHASERNVVKKIVTPVV